jgi:Mg-chelatase subunit ChlD
MTRFLRARLPWALLGIGLCLAGLQSSCRPSAAPNAARRTPSGASADGAIELPQADQRLCTGVVLLIDTSGSMTQSVQDRGGAQRPKHVIARDALQRIVDYTNTWKTAHPDRSLQVGIYHFSSSVREMLPLAEFAGDSAKSAVGRLPPPGGGTAIGMALETGFKALYASGCVRKYIVCITDGQNTSGPPPDRVAQQFYAQTGGDVELHFVAFDTSAAQFDFLKGVNGTVVEAADGEQLQTRLAEIYEKRILAEAASAEQP